MALAYDEVGALRNNTGCNKARMIRHIYHDSPLLAHGGTWRKSTARNQGSCTHQCFDSGRAGRSGGSHYLHISSVKLIVFTASLHEPTCRSNLVRGKHSSVPAKCGKSGHLRQARMLIDKGTSWLGEVRGNNPMWCPCSVSREFKASSWCKIHFRSLQRNSSMKTTEFQWTCFCHWNIYANLVMISYARSQSLLIVLWCIFYLFSKRACSSCFIVSSQQQTIHKALNHPKFWFSRWHQALGANIDNSICPVNISPLPFRYFFMWSIEMSPNYLAT